MFDIRLPTAAQMQAVIRSIDAGLRKDELGLTKCFSLAPADFKLTCKSEEAIWRRSSSRP